MRTRILILFLFPYPTSLTIVKENLKKGNKTPIFNKLEIGKKKKKKNMKQNKPEYGKHRRCSSCGIQESDSVKVLEVIIPPELPDKVTVCDTCLESLMDGYRKKREITKIE